MFWSTPHPAQVFQRLLVVFVKGVMARQAVTPFLFSLKEEVAMTDELIPYQERVVHVRFEGHSWDIGFGVLDVGERSGDQDVRQALACYFDVPVQKFAPYVVERHANGNITVRPEAVFG